MHRCRSLTVAIVAAALITSCGSQSESRGPASDSGSLADRSAPLPAVTPVVEPVDEQVEDVVAAPMERPATAVPNARIRQLAQPAIWPAADVVFATPEEAAESYVSEVLGVEPVLGEFQAGDSRSGEMQVFSPGEVEGAELLERGLLGLRMIGPTDGWFVIAANSEGVNITSPETLDRVAPGPLIVTGEGRGFEGTLVVTAFRAGDADDILDQVITSGGAFETLEPYSVTLDLSSGAVGDTIALMVRGDTGLESDPGDFASMPIVIDDILPPTS